VRVAICDDDALELNKAKAAVLEYMQSKLSEAEITLNTFSSGPELMYHINHAGSFDLIVLDILMPYMTGIEAAAQIRKMNDDVKIIFLTTSPEFAVNSYKVNAFYYLLKPFQNQELFSLLDKAMVCIQKEQSNCIMVKEKAGLKRIPFHLIEYVESVKHTLNFHLRGGETASCYAKMGDYSEALLDDGRFVHCHQSFMVNMGRAAQITSKYFVMQDQTQVPISRTVYPQVKQAYIQYFFHEGKIS
jgi:DNA-binding LytR/AlgR family response regulator